MTAYLIVMMITVGLGVFAPQQFQWPMRLAAFVGLLIFCGARIEVGPDWYSYIIYQNYLVSGLTELRLLSEPSFTGISIASEEFGWGIVGVNLAAAFIFLFGLFALAAKTPYPWCAIAVAFCYYVPALPMGIIRQGSAVGIIFLLVAYWSRLRLWQRIALVAFAMTFHISAVIMFGVILASLEIALWKRGVLAFMGAALTLGFGIDLLSYFAIYNDRYIEGVGGVVVETTAAAFHWLLVAIPAAWYLYTRKKFSVVNFNTELLLASSIVAIGLVALLPFSSAAVTRLAMYFSYLPIIVGGTAITAYKTPITAFLLRVGILTGATGVLVVWLTFAQNSEPYKPYKNYFTETITKQKLYAD
jgi:hypothetical protein